MNEEYWKQVFDSFDKMSDEEFIEFLKENDAFEDEELDLAEEEFRWKTVLIEEKPNTVRWRNIIKAKKLMSRDKR